MPYTIAEGGANIPSGGTEPRSWFIVPHVPATGYGPDRESAAKPDSAHTELAASASVTTKITKGLQQVASGYGAAGTPDTTLARSSRRVLELVNRRIRLFTSGGTVLGTANLNKFFGAVDGAGKPSGPPLFDPKVFYNRNSANPRFWAVALQGNPSGTPQMSRLYVAISRGKNPNTVKGGDWCRYYLNTRISLGTVADTWADYPSIGLGADSFVVTTNQYTWGTSQTGPTFAGGVVWAWEKADLNQNADGCPDLPAPYQWTADGDSKLLPHVMQPAQHYTSPSSAAGVANPIYLLNTYYNPNNAYGVWRINNIASGSPLLWGPVVKVGSSTNNAPPGSPGGKGYPIETGDTRLLQLAGLKNSLVGVHGLRCQYSSGTAVEACVKIIKLKVGASASGGLTASLRQQIVTGGGDGWYYSYPSIALNDAGTAVSAFNVASIGGYLGSAWGVKAATATDFTAVRWLFQGTCLRDATYDERFEAYRSGDYNGAAADPDGIRVWVAAERSAKIAGVGCGWQTRIVGIRP